MPITPGVHIDPVAIHEAIADLAEDFLILGLAGVQEEIQGGIVGRAASNPLSGKNVQVIETFLKDLAKELTDEEQLIRAGRSQAKPGTIEKAKKALDRAWKRVQSALKPSPLAR